MSYESDIIIQEETSQGYIELSVREDASYIPTTSNEEFEIIIQEEVSALNEYNGIPEIIIQEDRTYEVAVEENTYILITTNEYSNQFEIIIQEENNLSITSEEITNIIELNIVEEVVKYLEIAESVTTEAKKRLPITQTNRNSDGYITSIVRGGTTTYTFTRNSLNQITGVTVT